ncbi:MAG TPA: sulfotransferase [Solirubrobacterales bacterium]
MTLPTFFIIGAAKAGTTSLHFYLDQHPEIQMSATKEPNYFAGAANGIPYPVGRVDRLDRYERLFDPAFEVRGEASPSYTSAPRRAGVPERIAQAVPDGKFVYVVRDPIARTLSQYQMLVAAGKERRSLPEALGRLEESDPHSFYLTCQSFYAHQLQLYLRRFPGERILVIDQAELLADRDATLREVFSFLSVDPAFTSERFDAELFQGGERRVYPRFFTRFVKPIAAAPFRRLPDGFRDSLRGSVERAVLPKVPRPRLDDRLRARLISLYTEDVERLRELTGKKFPSWSI